jgi:hypothetical protein
MKKITVAVFFGADLSVASGVRFFAVSPFIKARPLPLSRSSAPAALAICGAKRFTEHLLSAGRYGNVFDVLRNREHISKELALTGE